MKFLIQKSETTQTFSLVYREEDYSFDIEPHDGNGFTSIMINDLQLEIDDEGKIIYGDYARLLSMKKRVRLLKTTNPIVLLPYWINHLFQAFHID